jgi:hypothetical protein
MKTKKAIAQHKKALATAAGQPGKKGKRAAMAMALKNFAAQGQTGQGAQQLPDTAFRGMRWGGPTSGNAPAGDY